jgi:hypothetical protein
VHEGVKCFCSTRKLGDFFQASHMSLLCKYPPSKHVAQSLVTTNRATRGTIEDKSNPNECSDDSIERKMLLADTKE